MKIELTPTKRGKEVDIFADIFPYDESNTVILTAKPISFRIIQLFAVDQPNCSENGPLITLSADRAREFAEQILKELKPEETDNE